MSKLVLEFPNDKMRDKFLGLLSDGGIEDAIRESMSCQGYESINVDYKKAFKAWGWDGKGDPTVEIK